MCLMQRDVSVRLGSGLTLIHKDLYAYNAQLNDAITDTAAGTSTSTRAGSHQWCNHVSFRHFWP
jgi:hypothetical protein